MFDNKTEEKKILEELMGMKTHNFWVKIIYYHKEKPNDQKVLESFLNMMQSLIFLGSIAFMIG